MGPKKAKASGDAAKGEKVFKNLCQTCHSLSVSTPHFKFLPFFRHIQLDQHSEELVVPTSHLERVSTTQAHCLQRLLLNGQLPTWTDGFKALLNLHLETPWLSVEFHQLTIEKILLRT